MTTLEHSLRSASKVNMHAVLKCWSIDNHFIGELQELVLTDLYFSVVILAPLQPLLSGGCVPLLYYKPQIWKPTHYPV